MSGIRRAGNDDQTDRFADDPAFAVHEGGKLRVVPTRTIESIADAGRLSRGRTYARGGQVISLELRPGRIDGDVQGSQVEPFSASVSIAVLDPFDMDALMSDVQESPGMLTELASGSVPRALGPRERWRAPPPKPERA